MKLEFLENSERLSSTFADALEYTYLSPLILNKNQIENKESKIPKFDCKKFKLKFFKNENPDVDVLLKLFMIKNDIKEEIIKNCLGSSIKASYPQITKKSITNINSIIRKLRSKVSENSIHIPDIIYVNNSAMNYIQSKKIKILIKSIPDLYSLLRKLKETNLLNTENIKAIIIFNNNKWDQNIFEKYPRAYKKFFFKFDETTKLINECLELFELESLEKGSIEESLNGRKCLIL